MYSDKDIARLELIKHMVDEMGLNLAGVKIVLELQENLVNIKREINQNSIRKERIGELIDRALELLGVNLIRVHAGGGQG